MWKSTARPGSRRSTTRGSGRRASPRRRPGSWTAWSYLFAWLGGCVSIGTFTVGSGLVGTLNLLQTFVAIAHRLFRHRARADDQRAGRAQIRHSLHGAGASAPSGSPEPAFPALVRSVPAIVWFGFQSWIGAGALNLVSATMFGYDNIVVFFIGFQFLQIGLSVLGFHGHQVAGEHRLGLHHRLAGLHVLQRDHQVRRRDP